VLLAGGAAWLMIGQWYFLGAVALILAAGTLLAGGVGLAQSHAGEKRRIEEEPPPTGPRIHNRASCRGGRPLGDKMARAAETLKQQLQERGWDADWAGYEQKAGEAGKLLEQGDLPGAFRESCRATRVLTEAWHRQRTKEEALHEAWEKHPGLSAGVEGSS